MAKQRKHLKNVFKLQLAAMRKTLKQQQHTQTEKAKEDAIIR